MTYRSMTDDERAELAALERAVSEAQSRVATWLWEDARRRSSLQHGDEAYCLETGRHVGWIRELLKNDLYSWECAGDRRMIDNNAHSYGKPRLGTKAEAAESLRRAAQRLVRLSERMA